MIKTAEEQNGFRKRVRTRDQILNNRMFVGKARKLNIPLYLAFIDFKEAFDSVHHTILCEIMKKMGMIEQLITSLQKLYQSQEVAVRIGSELTECFNIQKKVKQGCPASPICFNFCLEEVMKRTANEMRWVGVHISGRHLNNLPLADDVVLIVIWKDRNISKTSNLKILKTIVWPAGLYGCQFWTLRAAEINRFQAFEMSCYRANAQN